MERHPLLETLLQLLERPAAANQRYRRTWWDAYDPHGSDAAMLRKRIAEEAEAAHRAFLSPAIEAECLRLFEKASHLSQFELAFVTRVLESHRWIKLLPVELTERANDTSNLAKQARTEALQENNFGLFRGALEAVIDCAREETSILLEAHPELEHRHATLCWANEPGMPYARLEELMGWIRSTLVPIVRPLVTSQSAPIPAWPPTSSLKDRGNLAQWLCRYLGYTDRIQARGSAYTIPVSADEVFVALDLTQPPLTVLRACGHEPGHALGWTDQPPMLTNHLPFGFLWSSGADETRALLWEQEVLARPSFWQNTAAWCSETSFKDLTGLHPWEVSPLIDRINPTPVRLRADQFTYPVHVLILFELERELLADNLRPGELPDAWSEKYAAYLGIRPSCDRDGILQDIHWAGRKFGMFQSYLLGMFGATQLMRTFRSQTPNWEHDVRNGSFNALRVWLENAVNRWLLLLPYDTLLSKATSEQLNPAYWLEETTSRFGITMPTA